VSSERLWRESLYTIREATRKVKAMYTVEFMVKGAVRIITKQYSSLSEAAQAAARWRSSNSIGSYVAHVTDPNGKELAV